MPYVYWNFINIKLKQNRNSLLGNHLPTAIGPILATASIKIFSSTGKLNSIKDSMDNKLIFKGCAQ